MDASLRLRSVQHDKLEMANLTLLSLSLQKERDVCASRQGEVAFRASARNPVHGCFTALCSVQQDKSEDVIPSVSEESSAWMLRFAQHDKLKMANLTLLSLSLQKERDVCASRQGEVNPAWMLHCAALRSA